MTDQPETSDHRAPPSSAVGSAGRAPPGTASSPHAGRWFAGSTGAAGSTFAGPSFVPGAAGDPPLAAAVSLAAAYACGSIPTAFTLLWLGFDDPEVLLVWVVATAVVAAPMAAVVAAVGWRAERAMTGRVPPRPIAWVPLAVGVVGTAHWAPLCPWSPLLIGASMLSPSRAHVFLPLAVIGVVPWVLTTGALALAVLGRRSVVGRSWERATAADPGPSLVPTSVPAAIGYALSLAAPSALWLAWADEAFDRSRGSLAVIAWLLLGAGCGIAAGGAAGQWLVAAQATEEPRPRQLEVAGAVFAAHWAATFLYVLSPAFGQKDDLRFSVMLTAIAAITIGTAVWSFGRTARTIPGVWRRVVQ